MKKFFLMVCAVAVAVSCTLKSGVNVYPGAYKMTSFTRDNVIDNRIVGLYDIFRVLCCSQMYRDYPDDATRDLQWFALYGKCHMDGTTLIIDGIRSLCFETNGLPFNAPGAEYIVDRNLSYVCVGENEWEIRPDEHSLFMLHVTEQLPASQKCTYRGNGAYFDKNDDMNAVYAFDLSMEWKFVDLFFYEHTKLGITGTLDVDFKDGDRKLDWLKATFNGSLDTGNTVYKTSRD